MARARDVQDTQGRLRGLLQAYLTVARAVDLEEVLRHILEAARHLVHARYAALGVVQQGRLVRFLHTGMDADTVTLIGALPEGKGVLGRLADYPEPLRLANIADHVSSVGFPVEALVAAPIAGGEEMDGVLLVVRAPGRDPFGQVDVEMIDTYARQVGLALQLAQARQDNERLRWVEDHQHIAEDLHDRVIARLFGLGLSIQALASRITKEPVRTGLAGKVDEIDAIIRDIRTAVFALDRPEPDRPA